MKENRILLWFDVEDFITPEADDALALLLETMNSLGVKSTLKLVGEKARVLQKRGRSDIFRMMAGHEIGYHTAFHSVHPVTTEYLNDMGFAEGAKEFEAREKSSFDDVQNLTGQSLTTYGQPGGSWASQSYPALRKWGIPTYLDSHHIIDMEGRSYWYGGLLNWINLWALPRVNLTGDDLEAAKKRFDSVVSSERECQFISIYYHPCEFACEEFWDAVNFSDGKNPPDGNLKPARTCSAEIMRQRVETFRKFLEYTLSRDNTVYLTASEGAALEKSRYARMNSEKLRSICAGVQGSVNYYADAESSYAPSELLSLMAKCISGQHLSPVLYYGPENSAESQIHTPFTAGELAEAVLTQYKTVFGYPQLPDLYHIGDNLVSPADAFAALADAVAAGLAASDAVSVRKGTLDCAEHVMKNTEWGGGWPIFAKHFDVSHTIEMARLQTWTLKPAVF